VKHRPAVRQKIALLISNANFGDPLFGLFQRLSASIGRFSNFLAAPARCAPLEKDRQALKRSVTSFDGRQFESPQLHQEVF